MGKCKCKKYLELYPNLQISGISEKVCGLGMIERNKYFEFGNFSSGTTDREGCFLKILHNKTKCKIKINNIKNITLYIFIHKLNEKHVELKLANIQNKTLKENLEIGDTIYFGYVLIRYGIFVQS